MIYPVITGSEVAIMKKLDHPNVVKLFEVLDVQQDDSLFMSKSAFLRLKCSPMAKSVSLVVELCRKGPIMSISMGQAVEPMDEDTARNFFRQMILAIEYLHENGIVSLFHYDACALWRTKSTWFHARSTAI